MHDEIFHFEIFKNVMESLKYFRKFLIFIIKWLKTYKNLIKVYEVSRKYIMLFMHNNRYLPLTGLLYLLCCSSCSSCTYSIPVFFVTNTYVVAENYTACTHSPSWNFLNISEIFPEISWNFTSLSLIILQTVIREIERHHLSVIPNNNIIDCLLI